MNQPIHVTDSEFENKVLKSTIPVVVDFWAPWCGPCKMIAPILERISTENDGKVTIAKVNTDENPEWAMKYGIQGIPTLLFIHRGEIIDRIVGANPSAVIKAKVDGLLKNASGA
jgi:thioredoxin 1